jgi:hypothetical protein
MLTQKEAHLLPKYKTRGLTALPARAKTILFSDFNIVDCCGRPLAAGRFTLGSTA